MRYCQPSGDRTGPLILGPFIASGALSPILLYNNIKKLGEGKKDKRFEKIVDILLWRDYFRFMLKKYPNIFLSHRALKQLPSGSSDLRRK
jgi:deoxyribodipyrimidine photo-lyase